MKAIHCVSINPSIDVSNQCNNIHATHKIRLKEQSIYPGGGAVNVARVIQLLGGHPELTYIAGGETGEILSSSIKPMGIPSTCISTDVNTRIAFNVLDQTSGLEYRFIPKGLALPKDTIDTVVNQLASVSPEYLVLSGSLPAKTPADIYARIASNATSKGVRVCLDCSGEALAVALHSKTVFLAKPSLSELSQLAGEELDRSSAIEFALSLIQSGSATHLAVSMGQQGSFMASKSGVLYSAAVKVPVRSAVGAGDSFLAAIVHQLAAGGSIGDALCWGTAAGAAAVTTKGTTLCEPKVIHQVLPNVEISHL